jgi:hypothetical protein
MTAETCPSCGQPAQTVNGIVRHDSPYHRKACTQAYVPEPGHQVRVQRWEVPCPELPGFTERRLVFEATGTVARIEGEGANALVHLEGVNVRADKFGNPGPREACQLGLGYVFLGQDPDHGCSWTLQTEVVQLGSVAAHDQAGHDARIAQAEREYARAVSLWERARGAEDAARHRMIEVRKRLGVVRMSEPASLAEAVAATSPGHPYGDRELLNIARLGLSRIYTGPDSEVSPDMRECARQALARLEGRERL